MNIKYNLDYVLRLLKNLGYTLEQDYYEHVKSKLNIKCNVGHLFSRNLDTFINKKRTNCPECLKCKVTKTKLKYLKKEKYNNTQLLTRIINACHNNDYTFLYAKSNNQIFVKCKADHTIIKSYTAIKENKHQCRRCAAEKTRLRCKHSIEYIKNYIENHGETLLSNFYLNSSQLLKVLCKNEHEYNIRFSNYYKGHRCPKCFYKKETATRDILERLTNKKFNKIRPDFLKYKNGKNLELDGYNKELNIAFEYDGEQHFRPSINWGGQDRFDLEQERDRFKTEKCNELGIKLLLVPYYVKDKETYIKNWLIENKVLTD